MTQELRNPNDFGLFAAFSKELRRPPSSDVTFLPLSSLSSDNPTLPSEDGLAVPLPPVVFQQPMRRDILHRCVVYYLSLLRQGSGSTKTRAEVAKSGRKLYRQKGTGKARVGDAGSGTRRGGGTIHGPHPRDFAQSLPRKVQQLGLHVALSSKLNSGLLRVVQDFRDTNWINTRDARIALSDRSAASLKLGDSADKGMLEEEEEADASAVAPPPAPAPSALTPSSLTKFGPSSDLSILFVYGPDISRDPRAITELDERMYRKVRNIPGIDVLDVEDLAAYEVLRRKWTVLDASAIEFLAERAGQADVLEAAADLTDDARGQMTTGVEEVAS